MGRTDFSNATTTLTKSLHIVSLNIPFPANYGGVIDTYNRIVALKSLGINIYLHCFLYDRSESKELEKYCEKVYYYKRDMRWIKLFSSTPFIVKSRDVDALTKRLEEKPFPVLYDGLHCTFTLDNPNLIQQKFVRTHNVETDYYRYLVKMESNFLKKIFFYSEYVKLATYEKKIKKADAVFSISKNDYKYFSTLSNCYLIRAFHSNAFVQSKSGKGTYALYHGNLTVSENVNAVRFLLNKVFSKIEFPLTIAGKIADQKLVKEIKSYSHVTLIANPNQHEMDELIQNAQLVLLPTFQNTGIKLKLLESLFKGRFCVANKNMIKNTELEAFCIKANTPNEWIDAIQQYKTILFSTEDIANRERVISVYNNLDEAKKMVEIIFTS